MKKKTTTTKSTKPKGKTPTAGYSSPSAVTKLVTNKKVK